MDRRYFLRGLFGFAAAAGALATLPIVTPVHAAPLPKAPEDLDRAVAEAANKIEDGTEDAEWAKGGRGGGRGRGRGGGRGRGFAFGRGRGRGRALGLRRGRGRGLGLGLLRF